MFEGPVTGNIAEVLDNGEVTDGTHVTAGHAQVTDLAVNTAASGNNAAAIQSLDDRVTAELASKLDSSALAPAIAPLATAAALATTDGQVAAHGSSIAALQSSLTTGLVVLLRHSLVGSQAALEIEAQGHLADTDPPRVRHVQQIGHEGRVDARLRRLPLGAKNRRGSIHSLLQVGEDLVAAALVRVVDGVEPPRRGRDLLDTSIRANAKNGADAHHPQLPERVARLNQGKGCVPALEFSRSAQSCNYADLSSQLPMPCIACSASSGLHAE